MNKLTVTIFGSTLALCAAAAAAQSSIPVDTLLGATAHVTRMPGKTLPNAAALKAEAIDGLSGVIYSNFSTDPANLYDSSIGWSISGPSSLAGGQQSVAEAFTPTRDVLVTNIKLALGFISGFNSATVTLNADQAGLPGPMLKKFQVTEMPTFGICCELVSLRVHGLTLKGGTPYWLVVKYNYQKSPSLWAAWSFNNTGSTGTIAYDSGSGWNATYSTLGAFSVMGK